MLDLTSGLLATRTITGAGQNRQADRLELHLTALALRGKGVRAVSSPLQLPILGCQLLEALLWEVENVRNGPKADIADRLTHVRFTHESKHQLRALGCPLCANS